MKDNNPLLELEAFGQSIWMDFIRRGVISSGELQKLIEEDGVSGVTSNPSFLKKRSPKVRITMRRFGLSRGRARAMTKSTSC